MQSFAPRLPQQWRPVSRGRTRGPYQTKALTTLGKRPDYEEFRKRRAVELGVPTVPATSESVAGSTVSTANAPPPCGAPVRVPTSVTGMVATPNVSNANALVSYVGSTS